MERFQQRNWDESRWESEIRRDERRICAYFSALPLHLDMPDEEEFISRSVAAKKELISEESENVLHCWSYLAPELEDDDEDTDEESESRVPTVFSSGELMIDMLDTLACQWNEYYISEFPDYLRPWGINTACFYSRLLARIADFADACTSSEADPGLRTTLAKFVLSDIRVLEGTLNFMASYVPEAGPLIKKHLKKISLINDWAVHLWNLTKN